MALLCCCVGGEQFDSTDFNTVKMYFYIIYKNLLNALEKCDQSYMLMRYDKVLGKVR